METPQGRTGTLIQMKKDFTNLADSRVVIEDGTIFQASSFGAPGEASGEVVFNTTLTGYQEVHH